MTDLLPPLTQLELIETGIIERLKAGGLSADYLIESFPDDPDEFDLGSVQKAALVQYSGSRFETPNEPGAAQRQAAEFAIHVYLRTVGKPLRAVHELNVIRLALQGAKIQGVSLIIRRDGLLENNGTLWRYLVEVVTTPILAVPLAASSPSPIITDFTKENT